ncbi:MAG: class I SAM-dependent methyltransferase [Oscillospiraceae bacterium]|jgi:SAM-dependent methyltransferase|nr:class I SAM-dependent methyltransferase [Oscillospiraceae bacterium]
MTFWDFCAPFYDKVERTNAAYSGMLRLIRDLTPQGANVFEAAAGTGAISAFIADKAKSVLCTDISERMLNIAREKAAKRGLKNIMFSTRSIFDTGESDDTHDVVIASQVLHLIDEPQKAAAELKRISAGAVITSVALLKGLRGFFARPGVGVWRLLGFAPKREFDAEGYREFLCEIGLPPSRFEVIDGNMPIAVAVWTKMK